MPRCNAVTLKNGYYHTKQKFLHQLKLFRLHLPLLSVLFS